MPLFLGCPIWSFKGWVGNFYPKGTKPADFLHEYARRLTTIEGNTTFYAVPAQKTIDTWGIETPETFLFCPKVPKAISHEGTLAGQIDRARAFIDVMRQLGPRLGPMFLQLPPRYSPRLMADLEVFLDSWPHDVRLAVEVRYLSWFDSPYRENLNQLLAGHNMARVEIDTRPIRSLDGDKILEGSVYDSLLEARERKPDVPVFMERTTDLIFLRFIGHPQLQNSLEFVDEWVDYLVPQLREGVKVFVFCHSPDNLRAPYICREFHRRIAARVSIAPLPWDEMKPEDPEQPSLL